MISGGGHRRLQEARRQEMIREAAWAPDPNWPDPNWVRLWPDPMTPNRVTPVQLKKQASSQPPRTDILLQQLE